MRFLRKEMSEVRLFLLSVQMTSPATVDVQGVKKVGRGIRCSSSPSLFVCRGMQESRFRCACPCLDSCPLKALQGPPHVPPAHTGAF